MWPLLDSESRARLVSAAGLGDHVAGLVGKPALRIADLGVQRERLHAYHPDVVIVQVDCFFPVGPARSRPDPAGRLADFVWSDRALYTGVDLVERLSPARRFAVEVPWPQQVVSKLPPGFWSRRAAARAALEGRGYTVIADDDPWPDGLYFDGIHLDPIGQARFRTWLAGRLATIFGTARDLSVTAVVH
ncbi:MAG: hypothetical protein GXP62_02730 [Oligoflexia bacterium]|nr:hypothetical protein [Oligoflexia bacterium]